MSVSARITAFVQARASGRCEYCGMSQSLQVATFHVEHILPLILGGLSEEQNLALACVSCNLHKSDKTHAVDPESGLLIELYHPRVHIWGQHFAWQGTTIVGLTSIGRATITAFDLNNPRRQRVRTAEALFGLFPPFS